MELKPYSGSRDLLLWEKLLFSKLCAQKLMSIRVVHGAVGSALPANYLEIHILGSS